MITFASAFRDSEEYVGRYFSQMEALRMWTGPVRLVLGEGDSTDNTLHELKTWMDPRTDILVDCTHGGPKFGSSDDPVRWHQMAEVCNRVMDAIPEGDTVVWVESDLIWRARTMLMLLGDLEEYEAVAPLSLHGEFFYDIWGHRGIDGEKFTRQKPYHTSLLTGHDHLVEITSAGSCIAMRPEIAQTTRFSSEDCIVGFCRNLRQNGHRLFLDTRVQVDHP